MKLPYWRVALRTAATIVAVSLAAIGLSGDRLSAHSSPTGDLVVNGSFEDVPGAGSNLLYFPGVVTGWTQTTPCGFEVWSYGFIFTAHDATRLLELDAFCNGAVQQTVPTVAGQSYLLSYAFAARPGTTHASNALDVYINGARVAHHDAVNEDFTTWRHLALTFVASGPTTIQFAGAGTNDSLGSLLDSVSLVPVAPNPPPPPPSTFPPTFSRPFNTLPGASICTPLVMNTDIAGKFTWWVKAQTSGGPLTITAIAHAVNGVDPERVVARVYDASNAEIDTDPVSPGVDPLVAEYPGGTPNGTEVSDSVVIAASAGAVYRIEVSTPPPTVGTQPHFRLRFANADAVGTSSPSTRSFEHAPTKWYFNVLSKEDLNLRVLVADPPDPVVTVSYGLSDPFNTPTLAGTAYADATTQGVIDQKPASAGTWALDVQPTGHYRLSKVSGLDRGIYLKSQPGTLRVTANETVTGNPFIAGPVTFRVYDALHNLVATQTTPNGSWEFTGLAQGDYTVEIDAPLGWTPAPASVAASVRCDQSVAEFTIADVTPPEGACTPSYNPSTKNVPRASRINEDGFYLVSGSDTVSAVTITIGSYVLRQGETVKFTQSPGTTGVVFVNNQGREPIRHFRVGPGDPVITITDEAGNTTTRTCYVPPIPK